jgi:uncharacterized membrane protein
VYKTWLLLVVVSYELSVMSYDLRLLSVMCQVVAQIIMKIVKISNCGLWGFVFCIIHFPLGIEDTK